jgi:hypothetical protein
MIMKRRICKLALFLTACWIAVPAFASDLVPFQAVIQTQPTPTGSCGIGCLQLEIGGIGQATHMGRIEINGPSHVDLILERQTGTSVLTAANGDTLVIAFSGTVHLTGPNPNDPVTFEGEWTVIGGSGRFAGAKGAGTYTGSAAGDAGTLVLVGAISRPGGN